MGVVYLPTICRQSFIEGFIVPFWSIHFARTITEVMFLEKWNFCSNFPL